MTPFIFVLGACVGSFLNVVIWRLPRGESLSRPPSHCPKCGHAIRPWENIPILSWLVLRARCSSCRAPISARYPAVELLTAVVFLCIWFRTLGTGWPPSALIPLFFLAGALIATSFTDAERRVIPNPVTMTGIALGLLSAAVFPGSHPMPLTNLEFRDSGYFLGEVIRGGIGPQLVPDRWVPLVDSALGVSLALAGLWAIRVVAGLLIGRRRKQFETEERALFTSQGIAIGGEDLFGWAEVVSCTITIRAPQVRMADGTQADLGKDMSMGESTFMVRGGRARCGEWQARLENVEEIAGPAISIEYVRDVLGWGDIKLLAMVGALLGAEALPFIVAISAAAGILASPLLRVFMPSCRRQGVPFAPFVAAGCATWVFFGPFLLTWYVDVIG